MATFLPGGASPKVLFHRTELSLDKSPGTPAVEESQWNSTEWTDALSAHAMFTTFRSQRYVR
jgi:hypothetical protein